MYCSNCGNEIDDNAVICIHCGCETGNKHSERPKKSMLCAILLWFFLGGLGLHRFYLGHTSSGIIMLLCLVFCWLIIPGVVLAVWWCIDIFLLVMGKIQPKDGALLI